MARTERVPTGRDLERINDGRVAEYFGIPQQEPVQARETVLRDRDTLIAGRANRRGTTLMITRPRDVWPWLGREREPRKKGTVLLVVASLLVSVLAAGQGYVSWFAQFDFIRAAKHHVVPSAIEALGLDAGAVIFALLALALARLERSALVPRVLNVSCAAGSLMMNVLGADLQSVRSIIIYALPSALYATASDRLIAVVRQHALPAEAGEEERRSAWAMAWRAVLRVLRVVATIVLYLLRLVFAAPSTVTGLRRLLLQMTPLPEGAVKDPGSGGREAHSGGGPGRGRRRRRPRKAAGDRAPSKKSVLLALYAAHARFGDRAQVSQVAREIAPQAGLGSGTARAYLYDLLDKTPASNLPRVRAELTAAGRDAS
jgi:hypothetical protein